MRSILVILTIVLFVPFQAHSQLFNCRDQFRKFKNASDFLSAFGEVSEKTLALKQARAAGFSVKVLKGTVEGRNVEITFFGERHVNSEKEIELGAKVRSFFPLRGLEGVDSKVYWLPALVSKALSMVSNLYGQMAKDHDMKGSNITESRKEEIRSELRRLLNGRSQEEQESLLAEFREAGIEMPNGDILNLEHFFEPSGFAQLLAEIRTGNDTLVMNIPLETDYFGHKPSWKEQVLAIQSSLSLITALSAAPKVSGLALLVGCGVAACTSSLHAEGKLLVEASLVSLGYAASALPSAFAFRMQSNHFMVKNLMSALKRHVDQDTMLVTVGSAHVQGMSTILSRNFGFTEVEY